MLHQAISLGSAAAVLGALRMDMLTPELKEIMPFDSIQEAWEIILEKAENGCAFCQYMIGNTYYFLDIIEIKELKESDFLGKEAWDDWRRWAMEQSIPWFEKSFADGMILAGRNYCHYYQHGRGNLIPPEPEKEVPIMRQGAERGYPEWMYAYAHYLAYTEDNDKEALPWALKAAGAGHLWSWHIIGDIYWNGRAVERNLPYALECYEKTASYGNDSYACRQLGRLYFHGWGRKRTMRGRFSGWRGMRNRNMSSMIFWESAICWGAAASRTRRGEKRFWRKVRIRPIKAMVWG